MNNTLLKLKQELSLLSVFRSFLKTPVGTALYNTADSASHGLDDLTVKSYGELAAAIYDAGGNLTSCITEFVQNDENAYLSRYVRGKDIPEGLAAEAERELQFFSRIAQLTKDDFATALPEDIELPDWNVNEADIPMSYREMLHDIPNRGYGIFAKHSSFTVENGRLVSVIHSDPQTLDSMYGYEHERNMVLQNTRALAEGRDAANVLLYGDAGTGKSSTVKACANYFADRGVRLIQFNKNQLNDIPKIIDQVYDLPLKFIFFIDDLSFGSDDDEFCSLKGILEGTVTGKSDNIAIYATSNRRHLVMESSEARTGSDLHLNDTLQQTMSLSARFGMMITFSKPGKDLYLDLVKRFAEEKHIQIPEKELETKAEAFAIRANGRSPRTAKQFVQRLQIDLM